MVGRDGAQVDQLRAQPDRAVRLPDAARPGRRLHVGGAHPHGAAAAPRRAARRAAGRDRGAAAPVPAQLPQRQHDRPQPAEQHQGVRPGQHLPAAAGVPVVEWQQRLRPRGHHRDRRGRPPSRWPLPPVRPRRRRRRPRRPHLSRPGRHLEAAAQHRRRQRLRRRAAGRHPARRRQPHVPRAPHPAGAAADRRRPRRPHGLHGPGPRRAQPGPDHLRVQAVRVERHVVRPLQPRPHRRPHLGARQGPALLPGPRRQRHARLPHATLGAAREPAVLLPGQHRQRVQ